MDNNSLDFIVNKAIFQGNIIEVFYYENPYCIGYTNVNRLGRGGLSATANDKKINRNKVVYRARTNVRRLANANADILTKFLTLTFKDNITDIKLANGLFHIFTVKMNYYCKINHLPQFKYIAVIEFQKRGAIHYHLLCNLPYVKVKDIQKIWKNGFVKINKIDSVDNVGAYITKYMTKDSDDKRLLGNRSYFTSQGLKQPIEVTNGTQIEKALASVQLVKEPYTTIFENEYLGKVKYVQYVCDKPIQLENDKPTYNDMIPVESEYMPFEPTL